MRSNRRRYTILPAFDPTGVTQWATKNLVDDLTCSICLDLFTDPVALPCGHNMCKGCWESVENFKCPLCRAKCTTHLNVNKVLQTMVGVFPITMACGANILKQYQNDHTSTCVKCAVQASKHTSQQLKQTRRALLSLRRRIVDSDDETDVPDVN